MHPYRRSWFGLALIVTLGIGSLLSIRPQPAFYHPAMDEYILMYDDVRRSNAPKEMLLDFLQSTYEAGAKLAGWDRAALERSPG